MDNTAAAPPSNQSGRRVRPAFGIALALVVALLAMLLAVSLRARQAAQERDAIRRLWRLGTCILFEGEESYENPPFTPAEWAAEHDRSWLADLTSPQPTTVLFARPSPATGWSEPQVSDNDIPQLIDILRALPSITQVTLDKNMTPAARATLEKAIPNIRFYNALKIQKRPLGP